MMNQPSRPDRRPMAGPVGFLGVGTIATAMIRGLRRHRPDLAMHLSPRSEAASRALAAADPLIHRWPSNNVAVEAAGTVALTMLPTQLDAALREVRFRRDQIVLSCVANTPLADVATLVAPARACRLLPLPMIARHEGPLVVYPALPEIRELFSGMGDFLEAPDERAFAAFATGSAAMSTILSLQGAMAASLSSRGAPAESASLYVRSLFGALSQTAIETEAEDVPGLVGRHETPGGLNERVRRYLEKRRWFESAGGALDSIAGLRRTELGNGE